MGLSSLEHLNLGSVSLEKTNPNWLEAFNMLPSLLELHLISCGLSLPLSISSINFTLLSTLDLSYNNFKHFSIPLWLFNVSGLTSLRILSSSLQGAIPDEIGKLVSLQELGGNKLVGNIPASIGENKSYLVMLNLRANLFNGTIPQELCLLSGLQILDAAHNSLTGVLPQCLGNLSKEVSDNQIPYTGYQYMIVVANGRESQYDTTLSLVHSMDLSNNNFSGEIPVSIMKLVGLGITNLSMNHLTGRIRSTIGNLKMLESLDLSRNQLSGPIPESLSSLTFLSNLNLSYNNLYGKIPSGSQLQTLSDPSIYDGNPSLCGPPLVTKCHGDETHERTPSVRGGEEEDGKSDWMGFYISLVSGFFVGLWGVCGTLVIKSSWRQAYFRFLDDMKDKIIVALVVNVAR